MLLDDSLLTAFLQPAALAEMRPDSLKGPFLEQDVFLMVIQRIYQHAPTEKMEIVKLM